jgi:AcrR family transcriptional regulator
MALLCIVSGEINVKTRKKSGDSAKNRERERPLGEQDIIDAALAMIRARGVDALGMRGLAQKLGVSPMAIYYHVPNKAELLHRVAESLLAGVPTPTPSPEAWQQQLRDHAMYVWELLSACPGLSRVVLERPPVKASRRLVLHSLSLLRVAGFDERTAILCLLSFHTYLAGVLSTQARMARPRRRASKGRGHRSLSPEERGLVQHIEQLNAREWMEFGVETVLAGIRARHEERRKKTPPGRRRSEQDRRGSSTRA